MRSLRNLSLKTQIVVAVCFVNLAVIVLVSYGNYHWYSTQLTDQTMEQTQQVIEQAGSNINTYINELYRLTLRLITMMSCCMCWGKRPLQHSSSWSSTVWWRAFSPRS